MHRYLVSDAIRSQEITIKLVLNMVAVSCGQPSDSIPLSYSPTAARYRPTLRISRARSIHPNLWSLQKRDTCGKIASKDTQLSTVFVD